MEEETKPVPKKKPYKQLKYLLGAANTRLGFFLVETLDNRKEHPEDHHRILGTGARSGAEKASSKLRKTINKISFFQQIIIQSDVIVYDLQNCDPQQAELVVKTLKMSNLLSEKIVIFISNVMTWSATPPKEKKEDQEDDGLFPEEPDSQPEGADPPPQQQNKKVFTRYSEKDFIMRQAKSNYEQMRSLETMCLSLINTPNLKPYVLCSGILYGEGQLGFFQKFKQAWLSDQPQLLIHGEGKNRIPCIHIRDLCTFVKKIVQRPPSTNYIFGIDQCPKPTQKRLIEAISKGMGSGKSKTVKERECKEFLLLNIRLKPSAIFSKLEQEQAALQPEQGQELQKFKFDWHCKEGLDKNILKLNTEFNDFHHLLQNKVMVLGPGAAGKTHFSTRISQLYNLPYISVKTAIEQAKVLQNELGQEIRTALNEIRDKMIEEGQAAYDEQKQKNKAIPKDKRPKLQPFRPESVVPRLPDQLLAKVFNWKLAQNDCRNRGFVLDSYPVTYDQARSIFMCNPPVKQGQEPPQQQKIVKILNNKTVPQAIIVIQASDEFLLKKCREMREDQILNTHYTQSEMKRRLKKYRDLNNQSRGQFVLLDFFVQNGLDVIRINIQNPLNQPFESIVSFIQRKEKFINYKEDLSTEKRRLELVNGKREAEHKLTQQFNKKLDAKQALSRDIQLEEYRIKKENQANLERDILDKKSLSLRKYLSDHVVPFLKEGIIKICTEIPEDPVDYLAEYLFRQSLKVKSAGQ